MDKLLDTPRANQLCKVQNYDPDYIKTGSLAVRTPPPPPNQAVFYTHTFKNIFSNSNYLTPD